MSQDSTQPEHELKSLDEFIPYKLAVVGNRVGQAIGRLFEQKFNVQIPEWRVLMALHSYGTSSFYEVVERTSMDKARASRAQRRLIDLGLVSGREDPNDARKLILQLTDKGRQMCQSIIPEARYTESWLLEVLTDQERNELDRILGKLYQRSHDLKAAVQADDF